MANSKVQLADGTVLIDISTDTVTAGSMISGVTAHGANGELVTGNMVVQYYRTGTTAPSSSLGNDGDLYLMK